MFSRQRHDDEVISRLTYELSALFRMRPSKSRKRLTNPNLAENARLAQWLVKSTPEEIERLEQLVLDYPKMSEVQASLVGYILHPLSDSNESTIGLHETLALHRGFCGPYLNDLNQCRFTSFGEYVRGLRTRVDKPLDLSDPIRNREYEALLSFAFELHKTELPIVEWKRHKVREVTVARYKSAALKEFIMQHADRVEDLIMYARERNTLDIDLLSDLISTDGAAVLSEGHL